MKALYTLLLSSVLLSLTYITPSRYVVQVAAYGSPVSLNYFSEAGLDNVYRQSDQNRIYRYYIGEFDVQDSAEAVLREVLKKGFSYARIVDLEDQRSRCGTPCPEMDNVETTFAEIEEERLYLKTIYFDFDKNILRHKSKMVLDSVQQILAEHPEYEVKITGHTDSKGSAIYNKGLSERRARTARGYLINRGIHATRIDAKVYGEGKPAGPNVGKDGRDLPKSRQYNRRVVIAIVTKDGELISKKVEVNNLTDSLKTNSHYQKEKQGRD